MSYLHFVSAIEAASQVIELDRDQLLDEEARQALSKLRELGERHDKSKSDCIAIESLFRHRLKQVKRTFIETVLMHLDASFYLRNSQGTTTGCFTPEGIRQNVAAAYDIRSRYVHRGERFGDYLAFSPAGRGEVQIGRLEAENEEFSKVISLAPTMIGMERIVRYVLLKLASRNSGVVLNDEGGDA